MKIETIDLLILLAYLAATVAFGVWIGRGQKSATDYLVGGRDLPWWALLISIVATETSTATFLSVPGIAYGAGLKGTTGNLLFLQLPLGYIVGRVVAAYVLLPLFFKGELFTAYEVLRQRSGAAVRTVASGLFLVTRTLADGLRLYLAAIVVEAMTGWPIELSVLVGGGATLVYTLFGGIRAVVWTDVIQFVVYMGGGVLAMFILCGQMDGGFSGYLERLGDGDHLRMFDFAFRLDNTYCFWAALVGGAVLSIGTHGVDQIIVQRYLSARSLRDARLALVLSGPVVLLQFLFFLLLGIGLGQFYAQHPPARPFPDSDAVFPDFIVRHLPAGTVGIVLGAVFSAGMSTLSSSLNSSASALVNDFLLPFTGRGKDDPKTLRWSKGATLLFAGLQIAVGVSGLGVGNAVVLQVLSIASLPTGVILGLFLLALHPRAHHLASLIGLGGGLTAIAVLAFTNHGIAWPWYSLLSSAATFGCGTLARLFLRP